MKIIATHTATNANKTVTTMWKSNGGHSWYIGVLGASTNKIWHVGSERYIRGIWNREYVTPSVKTMDPREMDRMEGPDISGFDPEHFNLSDIPENGVRSIDLFDSRGRQLFSISVSTNGVCYQVLPAGEDADLYTTWEEEV